MKKKIKFLVLFFGIIALFFVANISLAQESNVDEYGLESVGDELDGKLGESNDIRITVIKFIQLALSFLGVIAVVIILYAGFLWMTSGGNEEKIAKAKKILINAVIGLIIILSSWTLATYFINKISGISSSGGGTANINPIYSPGFYNPGAGAIGVCSVLSTYPEYGQKNVARNSSIMITFKEEMDLNSICIDSSGISCECDNNTCNKLDPEVIKIFKTELGDSCLSGTCPEINSNVSDVIVSVPSSKKVLVLSPLNYLGSSDKHTQYSVNFSNRILKLDGSSMFRGCSNNYLEINFTVSNILDLTPPRIIENAIFPPTDNEKDYNTESTPAVAASAKIEVNSCPQKYSSAQVILVSDENAEASIGDYRGDIDKFKVIVPSGSQTKGELFNGNTGALLGISDFVNNEIVFSDFELSLNVDTHEAGRIWEIEIMTEKLADTLRINSQVYTFSDTNVNNNIKLVENCNASSEDDISQQVLNIKAVISGNSDIEINESEFANTINLQAKVAGQTGNSISLEHLGTNSLIITPFSGGVNSINNDSINDKEDKPRNSALQINFNEAINPITVTGSAEELKNSIRLVNFDSSSASAGSQCSSNSDCLSYKCDNSVCVGDYVNGNYTISSDYKTVEFVSDNECGINGCGELIYCLPANSHLKVEMKAANLKNCSSDSNCASISPFSSCLSSSLNYSTCQNSENKNYPLADLTNIDGIVDSAINSLDGNRSTYSNGPFSYFNQNNSNIEDGDSFTYSFYISNDIKLDPPRITSVSPGQGSSDVESANTISVRFNTLMLNNTLRSGDVDVISGDKTFNHKYINLKSGSPSAFGFWVSNDNLDIIPMDGEPDLTVVTVNHTPFPESMTFYTQIGSGVKDIYQNCYKPAISPDCPSADASCCFGENSINLDQNGNCIIN